MKRRRTTHLPAALCPNCGALLDAAMAASNPTASPSEGDMTVCISCVAVLQFGEGLALAKPSPEELQAAYTAQPGLEEAMKQAQAMALAFKAMRAQEADPAPAKPTGKPH